MGWIYVRRSVSHKLDLYKLGMTHNPEKRKISLRASSLPSDLELVHCRFFADEVSVERKLLEELASYRFRDNREFFEIHPQKIINAIERIYHAERLAETKRGKFDSSPYTDEISILLQEGDEDLAWHLIAQNIDRFRSQHGSDALFIALMPFPSFTSKLDETFQIIPGECGIKKLLLEPGRHFHQNNANKWIKNDWVRSDLTWRYLVILYGCSSFEYNHRTEFPTVLPRIFTEHFCSDHVVLKRNHTALRIHIYLHIKLGQSWKFRSLFVELLDEIDAVPNGIYNFFQTPVLGVNKTLRESAIDRLRLEPNGQSELNFLIDFTGN